MTNPPRASCTKNSAQDVGFRRQVIGMDKNLGAGTRGVYALVRQHVPFIEADTVLYGCIEKMRSLVADGRVVA